LLIACVALASFAGCCVSVMFVQGPPCTVHQQYITADKTKVQRSFFGGGASTQTYSASAEQVYSVFAARYPKAAESGQFLGDSCSKAEVVGRFTALSQTMGEDTAVDMASKEPILLLKDAAFVRRTFDYLKSLENNDEQGLAMQTVQNPKLLTIPDYEFQRTKPTLGSLAASASAIDFIRPLGEGGLLVAIFASFIVLLIVLRPILYGVGGQKSLVEMVTEPVFTALPVLKSFSPAALREFLEGYGISPAALVALIPIFQVSNAIKARFDGSKQRS
jgi:hypothetical protein